MLTVSLEKDIVSGNKTKICTSRKCGRKLRDDIENEEEAYSKFSIPIT